MNATYPLPARLAMLLLLTSATAACDDVDDPIEAASDDDTRDAAFEAARTMADRAEAVFTGQVTNISHALSEPDPDGVRLPFTLVTWEVDDAIKGVSSRQSYTARFLGGPLGDAILEVSEIPEFDVGDVDMVFIADNGRSGCPLVGGAEGRLQIERASGRADGVSRRVPDRHWAEALAAHLHDAGVGDGAEPSTPALDQPFVFDVSLRTTPEQRRAAAERARNHRTTRRAPATGDDAERQAFLANGSNPVLPR